LDSPAHDHALEAVNLLGGARLGAKLDEELLDDAAELTERQPGEVEAASPANAAAFARVVLLASALTGEREDVARAVDKAGEKAFVLEILTIGPIAIGLLQLALTHGRKSEKSITSIEVKPDGGVLLTIEEDRRNYSIGETLTPLLKTVLSHFGS
jgi:hypothetical protein